VNAASFLDSVVAPGTVTTTPTNSTAFTPGAITTSGILIQILNTTTSPSGTFTVALFNTTAGAAVAGATVTVNVSDLPAVLSTRTGARGLGWAYFKFASDITLLAATNYAVRLSTSVANQITVYTSGTTNWSRGLVTTTNAAPAATDVLIIAGNYTGAGTSNSYAVTMNQTSSATVYGQIYIATKGTLQYPTTAATYILRLSGNMFVTSGGTLKMGDSTNPIPNGGFARLELNVTSANQFSLFISGGTFITYGEEKSTGIKLAADASAGATSITLSATPTNWKSGETIVLASTSTTAAQAEIKNLASGVSSTTASIAALTNAHSGSSSSWTEADIANLNRNVIITVGATTTLSTNVQITGQNTVVNCKYTQFLQCAGTAATTAGVSVGTNTGNAQDMSVEIRYCSFYQSTPLASGLGFYLGTSVAGTGSSLIFSDNVIYNYSGAGITLLAVAGVDSLTWRNNFFVRNGSCFVQYWIGSSDGNIFTSSSSTGVILNTYSSGTARCYPIGTNTIFDNWRIYSNGSFGAQFGVSATVASEFSDKSVLTIPGWRVFYNAGGTAITFVNYDMLYSSSQITFDSAYIFGSSNSLITYTNLINRVIFKDCYLWRDRNVTVASAVYPQASQVPSYTDYMHFVDCSFAISPTGGTNAFSTSIFRSDYTRGGNLMVSNPQFFGTVNSRNNFFKGTPYIQGIQVFKENGVTGSNTIYTNLGNISTDTTIFRTSAPSTRLTPAFRYGILASNTVRIPVVAGESSTVSVWVRLSTLADGVQYNGINPELVYRFNSMSSNLEDTVVATASSTGGVWQQLSYTVSAVPLDTVLEFFVQCDGTNGWVNVDDWDTSSVNDSRGGVFFSNLVGVYSEPDFGAGGASYTFIN
jgi:hypothetical protein